MDILNHPVFVALFIWAFLSFPAALIMGRCIRAMGEDGQAPPPRERSLNVTVLASARQAANR